MRKKVVRSFQLVISILLISIIYYKLDISFSKINLTNLEYHWLFLAVLCRVLFMPFFASMRWKLFLRYVGVKEKLLSIIQINFLSAYWGLLMPSSTGLDLFRIIFIEKKHPGARGKVGSTVVAERLVGFILLSLIGFAGSLTVQDINQIASIRLILGCLVLLLLSILFILTNSQVYQSVINILNKIRFGHRPIGYLKKLYSALVELPFKKILPRALPIMILFQLSTIILGFLIFKAFNVNIPFLYHLALLPLIQIITIVPVSISGFGVREGAFVYFYSSLGVAPTVSFSVSILYYIISMGFPAICGAIISFSQHRSPPPQGSK